MIIKELKNAKFSYSFTTKGLYIEDKETKSIVCISRIEMFSLARFILRIAQKGKPRE